MTDLEDLKKSVSELRDDFRVVIDSLHKLETARAVAEERQIETSKKIDLLHVTINNNYVSAVEFGGFKMAELERSKNTHERIKTLETWQTWIFRSILGALVVAGIATLRAKGF